MQNNKDIIFQKLDSFIRKYYKNVLLKGVLLSLTLLLILFLTLVYAEHWMYFSGHIRLFLFILFILTGAFTLVFWIVIPLFKLFRIGQILSYEEASQIIGNHFPNIKDKLLNVLQLKETHGYSHDLILAAIQSKTQELKPINFRQAIDLNKNTKYLKFLFIPLLALGITSFMAPYVLSKATKRLIHYNTVFPIDLPYSFVIQNSSLECYEGEAFELIFKVTGEKRPSEIFLIYNELEHKVLADQKDYVSFRFFALHKDQIFRLTDGKNTVLENTIHVIPKSRITNLHISLDFPAYTKKKDENQSLSADLSIPEGTVVKWQYQTEHTQQVRVQFLSENKELKQEVQKGVSVFQYIPQKSGFYSVLLKNTKTGQNDTLLQSIHLIPDENPSISAEEFKDSVRSNITYYSGTIKDDYGFTKLLCKTVLRNQNFETLEQNSQNLLSSETIGTGGSHAFYHIIDAIEFTHKPGYQIEYWFEVWDNDGVHGPKMSKTQAWTIKIPDLNQIEEEKDNLTSNIKDDLTQSIQEAKKLQKELEQLWKDLANKRNISWEEKNKINSLLQRQKELQKELQKNNERSRELMQFDPKSAENEEILQKQQKIQDMMEELLSDDMKKMMEELQKLMDEANQKDAQDKLEEIKLSNEDIQKELDRTLELFKQLEFEQKLQENIDKLDMLALEQKQLNKKLDESKDDKTLQDVQNQQNQLKEDFQELQKELQKMQDMNEKLESKTELPDTKAKEEQVKQDMSSVEQNLQKNNKKGASKSQKEAAQKIEEMKQSLQQAQQDMNEQAQEENLEDMRQLMENLVKLSFAQEDLMKDMKKTQTTDPKYNLQIQTQKTLKDDAKMIEDSLFALSKRVPEIDPIVNKELNAVNENMSKVLDFLHNRRNFEANTKQQLVMTSVNNLALLFDEMIQSAQKQMSQQKGESSCNKPGSSGKPKPGNMRKSQQQLAKQLEQLKQELQKPKDGQGKPGGQSMSKELAKIAAQQEALRRQLQGMMEDMKANGEKPGGDLKKIGDLMEETERDIVNKRITDKTLDRQQEILTRLLESEKADRERDQDEKRESNESKLQEKRNLLEEFKYKAKKTNQVDALETIPPSMVNFYKQKVSGYFNKQ